MGNDMNAAMKTLGVEMASFEAVKLEDWGNAKYYNKEVPVTPTEVAMVKQVIDKCLQEQVSLALDNLKSANTFESQLTKVYFETGDAKGKNNVGRLLQSVSNTRHGLIVNLVGWLHKSHSPGKGQVHACDKRAL